MRYSSDLVFFWENFSRVRTERNFLLQGWEALVDSLVSRASPLSALCLQDSPILKFPGGLIGLFLLSLRVRGDPCRPWVEVQLPQT